MFRKTMLALTATVAVGAAALTPTTASAWHHHHHGTTASARSPSASLIAAPVCGVVLPVPVRRDPSRSAPHPGERLRVLSRG